MADKDVAIKSPESDAPGDINIIPGDTPAQEGASMGEHCVTDRPSPSAVPSGELSKIADIDVYITKPSDYPHLPSKLLIFLSSGSGIQSTNNQLQADKYASEGFLVVMPDQFAGDPAPNTITDINNDSELTGSDSRPSLIEKVKLGIAETAKSFRIDMWLARQTPEKVLPVLRKVIAGAKEEFADAVANGGGVYAVGYCFGGKYVLLLGSELPDFGHRRAVQDGERGATLSAPLIKAGAVAHGTLITTEDLENLKSPTTFVCTESDQLFPDEVRISGKKSLEANKVDHEMKVYSEVPHGFAVVGEYEERKIQEAQKLAFDQMVAWLKSH